MRYKHPTQPLARVRAAVREYGLSPAVAIAREAGYPTVTALGRVLSRTRAEVSFALHGTQGRVYPDVRDRVAGMMGISRGELDALIEELS